MSTLQSLAFIKLKPEENENMKIINCWSTTRDHGGTKAGDIVIIHRDDGKRKVTIKRGFNWYFYCDLGAEKHLDYLMTQATEQGKVVQKYVVGKKYIRVYSPKKYYNNSNVKKAVTYLHQKGVQTYEADVGPAKRFLLDKDFQLEDYENVNVMFFDIETDDTEGKIEYERVGDFSRVKAKDRILSFAAVDKKGKEYFLHDADEYKLLEKINSFLLDGQVDMLVGWNSKDFDMPYLIGRMEKNKLSSSYLRNILHEDLKERVRYFYSKDPEARQSIKNYSLNSISNYFLGESKVQRDGKVIELMNEDFDTFKEYNIQDARLVKKLEDKLGLIDLTYQMFQICQCTAQNWSMVKALDNFILSEANKQRIHFPTNRNYTEDIEGVGSQYLGAFVLDPVPGYYEKVYSLDFKSLYPNIIRTFNISPDSRMKKIAGLDLIETPGIEVDGEIRGKCYFDDEKQGIIPGKIDLLLEERAKIRKAQKEYKKDSQEWRDLNVKQLVVKELANSIYGIIGNKYFRTFSNDLAESITCTGQYLIKWLQDYFSGRSDNNREPKNLRGDSRRNTSSVSRQIANKNLSTDTSNELGLRNIDGNSIDTRKALYGDTDSIFVKIGDDEDINEVLRCCNRDLEKHIKKEFNVKESFLELALDKTMDKFLIVSKKKYASVVDGKLKYVGLECIKRDNAIIANEFQKAVISKIFKGYDSKKMEKVILKMKEKVLKEELDTEKIIITKRLGKDINLYKGTGKTDRKYTPPIQVRIVKELKNTSSEKEELSKGGSMIQFIYTDGSANGVHISEFKGKYDRRHYWNNLIYPQIDRILRVVYPDIKWVDHYEYHRAKKQNVKKGDSPSLGRKRSPSTRSLPKQGKTK